ncbi:CX3CL1: Fractalkine [Crotalus adamanteus]|uniref:CX3CL1: Fractalkine n=1 Tax=Crotalus adamanteus TaxID=8729 RepID=A0AAW1AU06_CROAD
MRDAARSLVALAALAAACKGPILAVAGEPDATKTCAFECLRFTKNKFPSNMLESYAVSTCRAKTSVKLKTKKNRTFCANGDHDWVKKVMQDIDARSAPSLSRYGTTTENLPAANRHLGGTVLEVEGHVQPTKKVSTTSYKTAILSVRATEDPQPFIERGLAGLATTTSSTWLTPQPETVVDKSTLQSGSIANNKLRSETTEGHQRFRELFTPTKKGLEDFARTTQRLVSPPVPFPGTDKRSTRSPAFVPETLTSTGPWRSSSLSKLLLEFVRKDKTLITIPTTLSNSSRVSLSSFSTDHKPQSVEESTAQLPTNSSSHSSTHSSSDRNSLNSVRFRGVIDADREGDATETSLIIGNGTSDRTFSKPSNTLPIPGYHQETFNESTLIFNPNMPPNCIYPSQSMVQNYIIPVVSVGVALCVVLAIGGLVYIKRNICTKQSPKRQVQGLLYHPCDSQAESYPMAIV